MKKYVFHIVSAFILSIGMASCDKVVEALLEEDEDDGLHRWYSVELYEPVAEADLSYTFTAKFSDMDKFRYDKMKLGFYFGESEYTPYHPTVEVAGEPYVVWESSVQDTTLYKWVDEIADDGTYSVNFFPKGNQQYECKACVLEELSDGTLQLISSTPFCIRGTAPVSITLADTLGVRFEVDVDYDWVKTRSIERGAGICWSTEGVPTVMDNYTPYTSYSFNFGDLDKVYLRGFLVYADGTVDYSDVLEYHPQEWTYHVRNREDLAHLAGTEYDNFRGTIVFETDMLEEENRLLNKPFNCYVEGNGHSLYFGGIGLYGHVNNVRILYTYLWELDNQGKMTNCYITGNNHVFNKPEGYISQCTGWITQNEGTIEDCRNLSVSTNYGVVRNCVNSYSLYYDASLAPYTFEWIVQTNTEYGIIEGCYQTNPNYWVCSINNGIIR